MGCRSSYIQRKDPTVFDVMYAVEECYRNNIGKDKDWHIKLIKIINNINKFTDGSGTNRSKTYLAKLLILLDTSLLIKYYKYMSLGDGWEASDIFDFIIEHCKDTVYDGYLSHTVYKRSESYSNVYGYEKKAKKDDLFNFTPREIKELFEKYKKDVYFDDTIIEWLIYWSKNDKASLVDNICKNTDILLQHRLHNAWDVIFDIVLNVIGKTEAYKFIVIAHKECHGWTRNYSVDPEKRLDKVAEYYKDKWKSYIDDVSNVRDFVYFRNEKNIAVGSDLLVYFLCKVGEYKKAEELTETMVKLLEEDLVQYKFKMPEWMDNE